MLRESLGVTSATPNSCVIVWLGLGNKLPPLVWLPNSVVIVISNKGGFGLTGLLPDNNRDEPQAWDVTDAALGTLLQQ